MPVNPVSPQVSAATYMQTDNYDNFINTKPKRKLINENGKAGKIVAQVKKAMPPKAVPPLETDEPDITRGEKAFILSSSLAGTFAMLALVGRMQKVNILSFRELKKIDFDWKSILLLSAGSIVGGLASGYVVDKSNQKDKLRESLQQFIGNIVFPVTFVSMANKLWNKASECVKLPHLKGDGKSTKFMNAVIKSLPTVAATFIGLGAGIIVGNRFANSVNNVLFKDKQDRKIKVSDLAAHVDDTLIGASLVANNLNAGGVSVIGTAASRLIPPALVVPGYITGTAQ